MDDRNSNYDSLTQEFDDIKCAAEKAIADKDDIALQHIIDQASDLQLRIAMEDPGFWVAMLRNIEKDRHAIPDQQLASYHTNKAHEAIANNDVDELRRHVQELIRLMPNEAQNRINSNLAGITK